MQTHSQRSAKVVLIGVMVMSFLALAGQTAFAEDAQWRARFWNNKAQSGDPVLVRNDNAINFNWGDGAPAAGVSDDNFSAQWTRRVNFQPGTYRFTATLDDAMRVYLDDALIMDSWYDSQEHTMTKDIYVGGGEHNLKVDYYEAGGVAVAKFGWELIHPENESSGSGGGAFFPNWKAEYYNNTALSGAPALVRDDRYLDHDWGAGSPAPGVIGNDFFSARWTKILNGNPGYYSIIMTSDDGSRLFVNNQLILDNWGVQATTTKTAAYAYTGGPVEVRVEYFEQTENAHIEVHLAPIGGTTAVPQPPVATTPQQCRAPLGSAAYVNVDSLNFREGPGTSWAVIATLPLCSVVELTGYRNPVGGNAGDWVQVVLLDDGRLAWAKLDYLTTIVPYDSLQVLTD